MRSAQLRVVNPCDEDYDAMRGNGSTRFCDRCEKSVTNLSEMTRADAKRFLEANAGRNVCVRYRVRRGELVFQPATPKRLAFVAILSLAMAACTGHIAGDDLDSPEDAMLCEDAYGYSVLCDEIDEGVIPDEANPSPNPTPTEDDAIVVEDTDPPPTGEGCPIPNHDEEYTLMGAASPPPIDETEVRMGDVDVSEEMMGEIAPTRAELRRMKRAERREARSERRIARRQR